VGCQEFAVESPQHVATIPTGRSLSHSEACRIARLVTGNRRVRTFVIDFKNALDASTSAFARLVLLRRLLLRSGRDLRLTNLHDRAAHLYQINRLMGVLPCT
jgi:hypothetical protein